MHTQRGGRVSTLKIEPVACNADFCTPERPAREEVLAELSRILASSAFHGTRRCQQFLEYVCDKALRGESGALKERSIAVEVFGRAPGSDLADDTIVRVGAREVRKRLAQYYVTSGGARSRIRIHLPPGGYAPDFQYAAIGPPADVAPPAPRPRWSRPRGWKGGVLAAAFAALAGAAVFAGAASGGDSGAAAFRRFWAPVFQAHEPLILAVAHPIVYHPSGRALRLSEAWQGPPQSPLQRAIQTPPETLNGDDLAPVFNQYVGFGDMVAATEISAMLAHRGREARVRMASLLEFSEMRRTPTLLIGAVTNRWTMELQRAWRFRFRWTPGADAAIEDSQGGRQWSVRDEADGAVPEDYFLVCRVRSSYTGALVIVAAGLKQFGTEAAGRLLADSDQLGALLRKLPAGWDKKNVQLVLRARVIANAPTQPEIVATHVW